MAADFCFVSLDNPGMSRFSACLLMAHGIFPSVSSVGICQFCTSLPATAILCLGLRKVGYFVSISAADSFCFILELCPRYKQVLCLPVPQEHLISLHAHSGPGAWRTFADILTPVSNFGRFYTSFFISEGVSFRSPALLTVFLWSTDGGPW